VWSAFLLTGCLLLLTASHFSLANAAYLTGLDAAGAAVSAPGYPTSEKIAQVLLTFDGLAFLPVLTAVVVVARLTGSLRHKERPLNDHVIVERARNVEAVVVGQLAHVGISCPR